MKIIFFALIALLILTGFIISKSQDYPIPIGERLVNLTGFIIPKSQDYPIPIGERLVYEILSKTAQSIEEKYNITPCGSGVSMPGGPVKELSLCFVTNNAYSKEQLRILTIKFAEELLNQVTQNDDIQKFLKERPFKINNVEIIIYNHDKEGRTLIDPDISDSQIIDGILTFSTKDPENTYRYKNKFLESYEEALKKIQD